MTIFMFAIRLLIIMMKIKILFLFLHVELVAAQNLATYDIVEEYNYFYNDTVKGEIAFGNYEPKDMLVLDDGSLIIGTELSFSTFYQNSHISSGSVFKLNTDFEKEWEIFFKDQRIVKVLKLSDEGILVVGEDISMKFIWIAELDPNGNQLWKQHYNYKHTVAIADAKIDNDDNVYILLESSYLKLIEIAKVYGRRRLYFFKDSEINTHLALFKISPDGKKMWGRTIDKNRNINKYGYNLLINQQSVFASYNCSGYKNGSHFERESVSEFSLSGKKVSSVSIPEQDVLIFDSGLVTITSHSKGELILYKSGISTDSIFIESADKDVRVESLIGTSEGYLIAASNHDNNRDYLLIKVSADLKFKGYWTYPKDEYNEIIGTVMLKSGEVVIVGKCFEMKTTTNNLITYINLVKIRNSIL